jgi:hypothetical protein
MPVAASEECIHSLLGEEFWFQPASLQLFSLVYSKKGMKSKTDMIATSHAGEGAPVLGNSRRHQGRYHRSSFLSMRAYVALSNIAHLTG